MPKGVHLPRVEMICASCGKAFSRVGSDTDRKHCSWACAKPHKRPPRSFNCERCGKRSAQTEHGKDRVQRFCSISCARQTEAYLRRAANRSHGVWPDQREAKAHLLAEVDGCEQCGWRELPAVLELHHVDRNRRNNRRSNLALLCPNCHTLHHYREGTGQFRNNVGKLFSSS